MFLIAEFPWPVVICNVFYIRNCKCYELTHRKVFYFKLILSLFANDKNIAIMALPITRDGIVYFLSVFQEAYSIKMTLI